MHRGFRPGNGCQINCAILNEVIRLGKKIILVGVLTGISKAFNSDAHLGIHRILEAKCIPGYLRNVARKIYEGTTTELGNFCAIFRF